MKPDFIIIGAMKCATSTLHDQLARVDGVSMSQPKEPNFFSDEINWARGVSWYGSLFDSMPAEDLKGESSTHYTKLPTYPLCVSRMLECVPDVKLIYVMRHPIDRIVSQYIHEWSQRVIEDGCTLDEAIDRYPFLVEYSRYAMQLMPFMDKWGADRILPVFFERLMSAPQAEFERVGRFLGISSNVCWDHGDAKNTSSQRQRRGPFVNAILGNRALQVARRSLMPESLRAKIRSRWTMKERPEFSAASLERLSAMLDPDMDQIGQWIGRDLCCANYADVIMREAPPEWVVRAGYGR
jgi:hypothetical protein